MAGRYGGTEASMKVIGITGGIASGKSLVASILKENYGAHLINTDQIAKEQMEEGGESYEPVLEYFGRDIVAKDNSIDRKKLAEIVFHDKEKLLMLNKITHPRVLKEVQKEIHYLRKAGEVPYLVIETALMIESGYDANCDEVWYVYAPEEERRRRLKEERNMTDAKIDSVFKNQSRDEAFRSKFSKVIENTGDIENLKRQVERLLS
jgi:dephospho-CoA kinase